MSVNKNYQKTNMTLTCDASAKPIGLVPIKHVVSRLASATLGNIESPLNNPNSNDSGIYLPGEAQVLLEDKQRLFRSKHLEIAAPLIVLFPSYIELTQNEANFVSRRVLFARDAYTCQYCGWKATPNHATKELTVDHVKPVRLYSKRSEATTWENVTTACRSCNTKKGGYLPRECGMMPARTPTKPNYVQIRFAGRLSAEQRNYVVDYFGEKATKHL